MHKILFFLRKKNNFRLFIRGFFFITLFLLSGMKCHAQFYAVKTDLLGLATGTLNAEISASMSHKWSVHLPVYYNPWDFGDNKKIKHLTAQPGVRYWRDQSWGYNWFFGANAILSRFNMGGIWNDYRYDGRAYGAGLSTGFSIPIHKLWNIDFEVGAGVVYTSYGEYEYKQCGDFLSEGRGWSIVPTKLSINLIYLF